MTRKLTFGLDEIYHIYTRGVEKRDIFIDSNDYFRFQLLLFTCNNEKRMPLSKLIRGIAHDIGISQAKLKEASQHVVLTSTSISNEAIGFEIMKRKQLEQLFLQKQEKPLVDIIGYTLMPNHFHLIIKERTEGGIEKFMHKLLMAYAKHFNTKYNRVGTLFVRPFKAKHINSNKYFLWLISYVHLNPVELVEPKWKDRVISDYKKVTEFMKGYKWSSYYDYLAIHKRPEYSILSLGDVPDEVFKDSLESTLKEYCNSELDPLYHIGLED